MQDKNIVLKIKRFSIVQIISNYLKLRKVNQKQYKGNCPFHKEKTPSFFVDIDGYYKCFGCNKGGDVINFVQEIENISFKEAVKKICFILKIDDTDNFFKIDKNDNTKNLILLNAALAGYFHDNLFEKGNEEILNYLVKIRKLNLEIIKKFKIGFCNENIVKILQKLHCTEDDLIKLSIIKKNQFGSRLFFENRIMIPIFDKKNNVISFGARIYYEDNLTYKPIKYLNGSNNEIFKKSLVLFNLNNVLSRKFEKKEDSSLNPLIVVEGYMDVISLEKHGIRAVASLGTSLTVEQLNLVFTIEKDPYFCYDADNAGKAATFNICKKIAEIIETGIRPKFILLKECKDIDEFLNKFSKEDLKILLSNAKDYVDYVFDYLLVEHDLSNPSDKSIFEKKLEEFFKEIKDKTLSKNYMLHIKNRIFLLTRVRKDNKSKINQDNLSLNFKSINILIDKLTSFLLQNPDFKSSEKLYEILDKNSQHYELILDVINDKLSLSVKGKLRDKYSFDKDLDYTFNSIVDAIKLDILKNHENNDKVLQKITRKNLLLKKK